MRKIGFITNKIARLSYVAGSICLILGLILSFVHIPASASTGAIGDLNLELENQPNACTLAFKCEQPGCIPDPYSSWSAPAGYQICEIAIKAGTHFLPFGSDGCADVSPPGGDGNPDYCVSGIGTGFGEAERFCEENGQTQCYAISHSEFYIDVLPPTMTPTSTGILPSATPTYTDTSVPPSQTPTPTDTGVPPTATSTSTGTITVPTMTSTSTSTSTPLVDTVTPTSTPVDQPTNTPMPTYPGTIPVSTMTPTATILATQTTPTPTGTFTGNDTQTPIPTSTESGDQVTPTESGPVVETPATLPPPQPTGTQPAVLIPVTGVDLSSPLAELDRTQGMLINFGITLLAFGLIFQGIGRKFEGD